MEKMQDKIEREEILKKDKLTLEEIWKMKPTTSFYPTPPAEVGGEYNTVLFNQAIKEFVPFMTYLKYPFVI